MKTQDRVAFDALTELRDWTMRFVSENWDVLSEGVEQRA